MAAIQVIKEPKEVRNWSIYFISIVASIAALAMGYDTSVIGGTMALDSFRHDFHLEHMSDYERDSTQANIVSTFQVGAFFGSLCTFPIAERFGRRMSIVFSCLVFCLGASLMSGANGSISMIIAGRAIGGFGIGSVTLVVPVYIAELSLASIRGRLIGIFEIFAQAGCIIGFWINYITHRVIDVDCKAQWVVPLAIQLVPAVLLVCGIFFCPESPRWLAKKERFDEAEKVLIRVRRLPAEHDYLKNEMEDIRQQVELRSLVSMSLKQQLKKLSAKGTRNRLAIGSFLMFIQSFSGVIIMTYYSHRIFESLGITDIDSQLMSTGFYGVAKLIGMLIFTWWVIEGLGRRKGLIYGALLASLPLWYVGAYVMKTASATDASQIAHLRNGWSYLAMVCIYLNALIISASWQGIIWAYTAEIFPLDIKMLCVAVATASNWAGSFFVARVTPFMITGLGFGIFFVFASTVVLMGIWAFLCIPETKGLSLEAMDELFSHSTRKVIWRQIRQKSVGDDQSQKPQTLAVKEARQQVSQIV